MRIHNFSSMEARSYESKSHEIIETPQVVRDEKEFNLARLLVPEGEAMMIDVQPALVVAAMQGVPTTETYVVVPRAGAHFDILTFETFYKHYKSNISSLSPPTNVEREFTSTLKLLSLEAARSKLASEFRSLHGWRLSPKALSVATAYIYYEINADRVADALAHPAARKALFAIAWLKIRQTK